MASQTKKDMLKQLQHEQDKDSLLLHDKLDRERAHKDILNKIGPEESFIRGGAQGASFGTAPYIAGGYNNLVHGEDFDTAVKRYYQDNKDAQEANPISYGFGDVGGTIGSTVLTGGMLGGGAIASGASLFGPGFVRGAADADVAHGEDRVNQGMLRGTIDAATGSLFKYGAKAASGLTGLFRSAEESAAPAIANSNIVAKGKEAIAEASPGLALGFKNAQAEDVGKLIWDEGSPLIKQAASGEFKGRGKDLVTDWASKEVKINKPGNFATPQDKYNYNVDRQARRIKLENKLSELVGEDQADLIQTRSDGFASKVNSSNLDDAIDIGKKVFGIKFPLLKAASAVGRGLTAVGNNYSNGLDIPMPQAAAAMGGADQTVRNLFAPANNAFLSNELSQQGGQ